MLSANQIGVVAIKYFEKLGFAADFSVCDDDYCQINFNINNTEDWVKLRRFTSIFSVVRTLRSTIKTKSAN